MNTRKLLSAIICFLLPLALVANPIKGLLERIAPGASQKFIIRIDKNAERDFFELGQKGDKIVICGNTYVNIASGLNWYLKYYAGIHLSWNNMTQNCPLLSHP